jgi:DNA-binding PadR family transcriptional regulator
MGAKRDMTDAELAILSIIAEGPIYGRDIQTVITQRGLRAWTNIGVSSMYYVLEKLERQGLVESQGQPHVEGVARRKYQISAAGFGVLQTAVADLLSTPREYASSFELGLANLHVLRPAQIRNAFTAYRQELTSRLAQARERWQSLQQRQAPFHVDAMFEHHTRLLEAELDWVRDFIEAWEAQAPPESDDDYPEPDEIPRMKQVVLPHDPDSPHRAPTRPLTPRPDVDTEAPTLKDTALNATTPRDLSVDPEPPPDDDMPDQDTQMEDDLS